MGDSNTLSFAKRHYERALEILKNFDLESDTVERDTTKILANIALLSSHLKEGSEHVSDYIDLVAMNEKADDTTYKIYENNQKVKVTIEFIRKSICAHIAENDLKTDIENVLKLIQPFVDA